MSVTKIVLNVPYQLSDGRTAVPQWEFSSPIDGSPQVQVKFHQDGNTTYENYPKVRFMKMAVRRLKDPPSSSTE